MISATYHIKGKDPTVFSSRPGEQGAGCQQPRTSNTSSCMLCLVDLLNAGTSPRTPALLLLGAQSRATLVAAEIPMQGQADTTCATSPPLPGRAFHLPQRWLPPPCCDGGSIWAQPTPTHRLLNSACDEQW